jgi:hypothetical protein
MLGKLILLPIILIKNVLSLVFTIFRSGLFSIVVLVRFFSGRFFSGVFGALIGFVLGSKSIGIRTPFCMSRRKR